MNATLALEDGTWYRGVAAGAPGEARGEVVFNTSMTGYQEVLTDPSYAGQIVTMTAPADRQLRRGRRRRGVARRRRSPGSSCARRRRVASNWRADGTLRDYLVKHGIVAIADIDTRALTRVLRSAGVMRGVIATGTVDPAALVEQGARRFRRWKAPTWCKDVTCASPFEWRDRRGRVRRSRPARVRDRARSARSTRRLRVAAYDFGMKYNILRRLDWLRLRRARCFPPPRPPRICWRSSPDGIFLSNGPGDPAALDLRHRQRQGAGRLGPADVRHLPRPPDARPGASAARPSS